MTAEELGLIALGGVSGSAVADRLGKSLRDAIPASDPRIIQWRVVSTGGTGYRGGRSRGPYRLGLSPEDFDLDAAACYSFLAGQSISVSHIAPGNCIEQLRAAREAMFRGDLTDGRALVHAALIGTLTGSDDEMRRASQRDRRFQLAQVYSLLANIEMEMGYSCEGLDAVGRARALFERVKHPEGVAHAFQIEALLFGQSGTPDDLIRSVAAAKNARLRIDSAPPRARAGASRAAYIGVLGQRLTPLGRTREAARHLQTAFRLCEAAGNPCWMAIWAVRQAQNAIAERRLGEADRFMATAYELATALTVSGTAVLARASLELCIAAGRRDEAAQWIQRAHEIGVARRMLHQERLVRELGARLDALG